MTYRAPARFIIAHTRIIPSGPRTMDTAGIDKTPTSGLGAITIPDYTLWSSGDIAAFYNVILNAVSQLAQDIAQNVSNSGDGAALRSEFTAFKNSFASTWAQYHDSWPAGSSATPVTRAREAAQRYNAFEIRYRDITGRAPTASGIGPISESHPERLIFGQPLWVWGVAAGGGVVALGLVAWMVSSVGRTAAAFSPAALLHNPPRRRRRARRPRRAR